jgi:hypothetical protein
VETFNIKGRMKEDTKRGSKGRRAGAGAVEQHAIIFGFCKFKVRTFKSVDSPGE